MSEHAYPRTALLADVARAAGGIALAGIPLAAGALPTWQAALFVLIAMVFALFAAASLRRAMTRIEAGDEAIAVTGPWPARLRWGELDRLRLAYYSTRRDGAAGWMHLTLAAAGRRVVIDSRIGGFDLLVRLAARAARARALRLDAATIANLRSLGVAAEPAPSPRGLAR